MPQNLSPSRIDSPAIAIIGAGIAGLSCAKQLLQAGFDVELFEKSRGPGGRMSTRYVSGWTADHGAQYFTARDPQFIQEIQTCIKNHAVASWHPRLKIFAADQWRDSTSAEKRFIGIPDMSSVGKYLAKDLSIQLNQTINQVQYKQDQWVLHSREVGEIKKTYDGLVIALPAPQVGALCNNLDTKIGEMVASFQMKGCWTVMVRFSNKPNVDFDAAFINHEIISWICRHQSKALRNGADSWTIHANPEWSQRQ